MSWSSPVNAIAGSVLTASYLNTYVNDNMRALIGLQWFYVDGGALRPDLTNGCSAPSDTTTTAGNPLIMGASFSGSADQYAQFKIPFPKRWNASTVTFRVRWNTVPANTGAGSVVFNLAARAASDTDSIDGAYGTPQYITDTFSAVKKHMVSSLSAAITIGNTPAKEDCTYFRFGRIATDGNDTKTDAIVVEGIEVFMSPDTANDA